jgi:ABC-2 type transport system ATP-binding protein
MIQVSNVGHSFGGQPALKDISFTVAPGSIFGLLGPNGAGKSTLINILVTLLQPESGTVTINGWPLATDETNIRGVIGVLFQDPSLDERLTAYENLYFHAKFYHVPPAKMIARIEELLKLVGLTERRHDLVMTFSGGMKRRLEIARSILHRPKILLLDEPTVGLDPQARRNIWAYIKELHQHHQLTILLTTHYLEEAEICDQIAILDHGAVIACDTPNRLKTAHHQPTLEDLFIHLTGRSLQDSEAGELEHLKATLHTRRIK